MGSQFTPKLQSYNINQISTQGALLQRAAAEFGEFSGSILAGGTNSGAGFDYSADGAPRGSFLSKSFYAGVSEKNYFVWGDRLYILTYQISTATLSSYNPITAFDIDGTGRISAAEGYNGTAFCGGGQCYFLDTSSQLTELTDVDLPDCVDVTRVDGRFVWTPSDGSPLIYSEINDAGNIDSLAFFDAETLPDVNKATVNLNNDLFALGAESIERFRNVGTSSAPFLRVNNSIISVGYVSGIIEAKDSFGFLGRDKGGGFAFFVYTSGGVQKISSDKVTEDLNTNYTITELDAVHGQRFNWGGIDCFVWTMADKDYLFNVDTGWSYITSGTTFSSGLWGFSGATNIGADWYTQGVDGIYKLTSGDNDIGRGGDTNTDPDNFTDDSFIRGFQLSIREPSDTVFQVSRIDVGIEHTTTDSTVNLSVSRDGSTWSTNYPQTSGTATTNKLVFNGVGGLGRYDGYAGIRISSTDNVAFSVENMNIT